jgi:hypothetical protein
MENLILYESPFPKRRVGKPNDGGYAIVILPGEYDLFLSGGILNDISFEESFLSLYPIECYAFDGTIDFQSTEKIKFVKQNLGDSTNGTTNLHEYMFDKENVFMKIDIEGHEFRLFPSMIQNGDIHKVKQLVVEIHCPADIELAPHYYQGLSDIKNEHMFQMLHDLTLTHTLVHFHANNGPPMQKINDIDVPHVFELTWIRNDFIEKKIRNTYSLPTKIDMKNIIDKPDFILKGFPYTT